MKLSLCMILKNEEPTIYRCLDSVKGIIDEYIIGIDDSCDDKTEDEVNRFFKDNKCDKTIYKFKWNNSFSKLRNAGMDMATGNFIMILDGHEYFPEKWFNITEQKMIDCQAVLPKVKEFIEKDNPDEAYFQLYQQPFIGHIPNNFFLQPRVYRNDPKIRFCRDSHNTITSTDPDKHIHFTEIILVHDAPESNRTIRKEQRVEMNIDNLEKMIKDNTKDTRAMFYLGNTLMEARDWKNAIKSFNNYLKHRKDENSEKYQVLLHKSLCQKEAKDYKGMKNTLYQAMAIDNHRRDARILLGDMYCLEKEWAKAILEYDFAIQLKPIASRMFQNGGAMTYDPYQKLAGVHAHLGNMQKAIYYLKIASKFNQNEKWDKMLKIWTGDKKNILVVDKIGSFTKAFIQRLADHGYNVISVKKYDPKLGEWADRIWQEWADDNAVMSSCHFPSKTIIRVHGYEYYLLKQYWDKIKWNECLQIVFVAKHIEDKLKKHIAIDNAKVIYNGVDLNKYFIKNYNRDAKAIGYAGFINEKKNPFLLVQIIRDNPEYTFNLRVDFQDPFWEEAFKYELRNCKNVVYHGWYEDLSDFWNQMSGVLSTSIIESFSYNIAEAMACGCKPYIYDWEGARDIWDKKYIFEDKPVLNGGSDRDEMKANRKYIEDHYPLEKSLKEMEEVLMQ